MSRAVVVFAVLVLVVGGVLGVAALFAARDGSTIAAPPPAPGEPLPARAPIAGVERGLPAGNVVLLHRDAADGRALRALADELGGPPTATLRQAGQAVLVARQPQIAAIEARAAGRRQAVTTPDDPALRAFVEFWLGRRAS